MYADAYMGRTGYAPAIKDDAPTMAKGIPNPKIVLATTNMATEDSPSES